MFDRFNDRARRVVVHAQEQSARLKHSCIDTEHLLLALATESDGVSSRALQALGVDRDAVQREVIAIVGPPPSRLDRARLHRKMSGHIPWTDGAKKALELAVTEAQDLGHNYVGDEHVLLGVIREGHGVAARVLTTLGADLGRVREEVLRNL